VPHQQLNEELLAGDLKKLVNNIFEIDSYASKMGSDQDVVVLSFTVESKDPAEDLVRFCERGFDFVLDADHSPGELDNGKYKVFVEIERNRRVAEQIDELLNGIKLLAEIDDFKFRYYKNFKSLPATIESLREVIPNNKQTYLTSIQENHIKNFSNFFSNSYLESINTDNDDIVFQKSYFDPLRMTIKDSGPKHRVYENIKGPIMLEHKDISEVMFLTKYIGNYNITKVGNQFVFENNGYAVALEKK